MYFLYSLALSVLFCALLPYFIYQSLRHGKYAASFKERMGWLPLQNDARETIWVHAVSVGEFVAARALIGKLKADFPAHRLVVSTTTLTGQRLARSASNSDAQFYFPFDWKFAVQRALDRIKPSLVIILETELWPNFLRECRMRKAIVILANGRISERSYRRYLRVRPFIRRVVDDFSLMIMQTEEDAERARQLGARRVQVCGNLKYDVNSDHSTTGSILGSPTQAATLAEIDRQFSLSTSRHVIVAGSTAPGEEELLLKSFGEVRGHRGLESSRMLIAPRHPERFNEVARLIARSRFTYGRRSDSQQLSTSSPSVSQQIPSLTEDKSSNADIILLDTIGELALVYTFAAVVFVGGSLVPRGGHNVIEPAVFAKPIIVGPYTENFRQIISDFAGAGALLQVEPQALTRELIRLLSNPDQAREMGGRARNILISNKGATERTMREIRAATDKK